MNQISKELILLRKTWPLEEPISVELAKDLDMMFRLHHFDNVEQVQEFNGLAARANMQLNKLKVRLMEQGYTPDPEAA